MNIVVAICSNNHVGRDISFYFTDYTYNYIVVHCNVTNFYSSHILHKTGLMCKFTSGVKLLITPFVCYFFFWAIITRLTAMNTSTIPIPWFELSFSPKTAMPTNTAVRGSIHPKMAVVVEPIICIA